MTNSILNFDTVKSFALLKDEDSKSLIISAGDNMILLNKFRISDTYLRCKFSYSGEYHFYVFSNYECSIFNEFTKLYEYRYCSSLVKTTVIISIASNLVPLWIIIGIVFGILLAFLIFIILYKYGDSFSKSNKVIHLKNNDKTPIPLYNNPKFLGIDLDDIKLEDGNSNNL